MTIMIATDPVRYGCYILFRKINTRDRYSKSMYEHHTIANIDPASSHGVDTMIRYGQLRQCVVDTLDEIKREEAQFAKDKQRQIEMMEAGFRLSMAPLKERLSNCNGKIEAIQKKALNNFKVRVDTMIVDQSISDVEKDRIVQELAQSVDAALNPQDSYKERADQKQVEEIERAIGSMFGAGLVGALGGMMFPPGMVMGHRGAPPVLYSHRSSGHSRGTHHGHQDPRTQVGASPSGGVVIEEVDE